MGANIHIPGSGAKEIMLPPSAIRNPGLERAPGAVGGNHQTTVGATGVSGQVPNPTQLSTPVQPDKLASLLIDYNQSITDYLLTGFLEGFKVGFSGESTAQCPRNLLSAIQLPHLVSAKLQKEMDLGRISGHWPTPPFPNLVISPVGLVPKKSPGAFRLIHHLSHPQGSSVNAGIPPDFTAVHYASVDDAIAMIKRLGPGCFLAKADIKSAFRIIPLHRSDYHLFGIKWRNQYYFDICLPMGCASSCRIFKTFSTSLEWVAKKKLGSENVAHILDDFLFAERTLHQCSQALAAFLSCCEQVGVPIAVEKTVGPSQVLSFAGIELDTVNMEARLPLDKLTKCRDATGAMQHCQSVTLKQLTAVPHRSAKLCVQSCRSRAGFSPAGLLTSL